eukprot:4149925-Prymnesium_polylepis.1
MRTRRAREHVVPELAVGGVCVLLQRLLHVLGHRLQPIVRCAERRLPAEVPQCHGRARTDQFLDDFGVGLSGSSVQRRRAVFGGRVDDRSQHVRLTRSLQDDARATQIARGREHHERCHACFGRGLDGGALGDEEREELGRSRLRGEQQGGDAAAGVDVCARLDEQLGEGLGARGDGMRKQRHALRGRIIWVGVPLLEQGRH